jgi:DivIVA domain-containing protein
MAYGLRGRPPWAISPREEVRTALRLTPEEIEARRFRLAQNGYDCESVDRFLAEIADALRSPESRFGDADDFGRIGQEIAALLRNAHESAGAVKAEAEGQAAALRSRAELAADDMRKAAVREAETTRAAAQTDAETIRTNAQSDLEASQAAVRAEIESLRAAAESEAAEIRTEAERQLEQAAAIHADADREAAAWLEQSEHEARRRADEIQATAERHAGVIRESEQSTYLRLLAARDDVQHAIDHLVSQIDEVEDDSVVDLTIAPAQVHPATSGPSGEPATPAPTPGPAPDDAPDREDRGVGSADLDDAGHAGDPLLRMVRAAVGRASRGSTGDGVDREASAS